MSEFRLLETGFQDGYTNMAIDEAVVNLHKKGDKPTIRFYGWKPHAVSIGYFQGIEEEVDLAKAKELDTDVVRRITGGGAVFHERELTYSFVCTEESNLVSKKILDSYKMICGGIVKGLDELEVKASFVPLNDIIVNDRKISGNAQTRRERKVLQHGTLLLGLSVDKMFSLLKVPDEKMKGKIIESVKQRVTSLEQETGREYSFKDVSEAMQKGFEKEFGVELVEGELNEEEKALAEELREKFSSKEWNFKR
ncbi:MAG: lipoate--protein ligase [Candidatus Diapherotrites archaeon]|uniref:Lipoate--protein ligase n=1 Tax=Candidatus Iainarchaeum sp. TaxID=3101447 RepID=A0A2D6M181_9ARCH|nr:lipoate--protein ligase [Candidatus Diapherotrites archaeon]|tara:strand:+ start:3775 stop:4530 length:756 start_codon:yes stop_codon:yes gene_type:complete